MRKRWLTWEEIHSLGIQSFELLEAVKAGKLTPYVKDGTDAGKKAVDIESCEHHKKSIDEFIAEITVENERESGTIKDSYGVDMVRYWHTPLSKDGIYAMATFFHKEQKSVPIVPSGCIAVQFSTDNVKTFIYKADKKTKAYLEIAEAYEQLPASEPEQVSTHTPEKATPANFFTRENGDYWHIGFEGQTARIKHIGGLLYIGYLLEKQGTSISCRELYQAASGKIPGSLVSEGAAIGEGLNIGSSKQAISSPEVKAEYMRRYMKSRLSG